MNGTPQRLTVTRIVTRTECPWLRADLNVGDELYRFTGAMYGVITNGSAACVRNADGSGPFFEVPIDAIRVAS
jgi:hypothetical protein